MIEDQLQNLRRQYIKTPIPAHFAQNSWLDLSSKLSSAGQIHPSHLRQTVILSIATILLMITAITGVAQAAKPGSPLYQVKILSDNLIAKITGNQEIKIEKRAQEVIDLATGSEEHLDEATKEYQKALDQAKQELQKSGRQQEFKEVLEEQEEKFREAQEKNPASQNNL